MTGDADPVPPAATRDVVVRRAGAGQARSLRAGRGEALGVIGPDDGSSLDIHVNALRGDAGSGPYHRHDRSDNFFLVLDGRVRMRIAGADYDLQPGDAVHIPRGVPHAVAPAAAAPVRLIEIYAPAEPDFVDVADPQQQEET